MLSRLLMGAGMPLGLVVLLAPLGTLGLSDAARVSARQAETDTDVGVDVQNTPRLVLGLAWPTTQLSLGYAPRMMWIDVLGEQPSPTLVLHTGELQLRWSRPRIVLTLTQTVAVGDESFVGRSVSGLGARTTETPTEPTDPAETMPSDAAELDLLPDADVVAVFSEETSAGLRYDWTRRMASELRAAFGFSGGADTEARVFVPQRRTTQLEHALLYRLSRRDELSTAVSLAQVHTSNGYDHRLASLMEIGSTRFERNTGGELGAGASFQHTTGPDDVESSQWIPVGVAGVWHELLSRSMRTRFGWDVAFSPSVDTLAGTLQSRVRTSAEVGVTLDRTSVRLVLGAAQTLPTDAADATTLLSADLAFERQLLSWLELQLGGQISRQRVGRGGPLASTGSRWLLYAGLEGHAPEVRF